MKKLFLTTIGLYLLLLNAFSQSSSTDSTGYEPRPLNLEEANLVTSYYQQTGDHSAVTGGIGTEKVTDFSNGFELKFTGVDYHGLKHTLTAGLGIDHHTSASSAYVSKTGASKTGGSRVYPSLNWEVENRPEGTTFGAGLYYSSEYNYKSFGINAEFAKKTNSNGEFSAKGNVFFDQVKLIYPSELVPGTTTTEAGGTTTYTTASGRTVTLSGGRGGQEYNIPSSPRTTVSGSFSFSQIMSKRLQGSITVDVVGQSGYLGLPFHRVYFTTGTDAVENLPSSRYKLPVGVRLNYFLGDKIILRSYYRYYTDDWGITSHTASLEVPVKVTPFFSIAPFYRYYVQTAAAYFAPYEQHKETDTYYTSNYAYSAFSSAYAGVNIRIAPPKGLFNSYLNTLEIRYGHYTQTTDLASNVISLAFTFK
ncbi:MAG TPA: DUF3570 domain-containing protein [Chitinophagaceae bacterium]|nr:DUF3570 domain-containing protein [Chitinophagaceae bacterium]